MKTVDIIYNLRKIEKSAKAEKLDVKNSLKHLRRILGAKLDLPKEEKTTLTVLASCMQRHPENVGFIAKLAKKLLKYFEKVAEKEKVMEIREAKARVGYFKVSAKSNDCRVDLTIGDVVYVPTQGGMHYSVVVSMSDKEVKCHPLTTAPTATLSFMGVKSVEVKLENDEEKLRLTASCVKIPKHIAMKNKKDKRMNKITLQAALDVLYDKDVRE